MIQELMEPVIPLEPCLDQEMTALPSAVGLNTSQQINMVPTMQMSQQPSLVQQMQQSSLATHLMTTETQGGISQEGENGNRLMLLPGFNPNIQLLNPELIKSLLSTTNMVMFQGNDGSVIQMPSSVMLLDPSGLASLASLTASNQVQDQSIFSSSAASAGLDLSNSLLNTSPFTVGSEALAGVSGPHIPQTLIHTQSGSGPGAPVLVNAAAGLQGLTERQQSAQPAAASANTLASLASFLGLPTQRTLPTQQNLVLNCSTENVDQTGGASLSSLTLSDSLATSASQSTYESGTLSDQSQASSQATAKPPATPVILKCPCVANMFIAPTSPSDTPQSHNSPLKKMAVPGDGTLTSAIQKGVPIFILPGTSPESVVLNQVFVPIYSNTDKGPVIELIPIKPSS